MKNADNFDIAELKSPNCIGGTMAKAFIFIFCWFPLYQLPTEIDRSF